MVDRSDFPRPPSDEEFERLCDRHPVPEMVYAVVTTGVVCPFGCPARPPARRNVVLYPNLDAAQNDGFRLCRRTGCRAGKNPVEPGR